MNKAKNNQKSNSGNTAIKVTGLSKNFKIPHEKNTSLKGAALNMFNPRTKGYEILHALENINFEIKEGEFFGIIGRNGSGKSTLLKILAGIYVANGGSVSINGKISPFLELGVGFNPELTARENVFLGGAILGLSRKEIVEKFDRILSFAELEEFVDMKFKNFSSGMQVRLAFALAINAHADILLMDEVLAVGDTNFQSKCIDQFIRYKKEGKTVILVSHDINTVQRYCDRVLFLDRGKAFMIGKAQDVVKAYTTENIKKSNENLAERENSGDFKAPQVKSIRYQDKAGRDRDTFNAGDSVTVKVDITNPKNIGILNFGISLLTDKNEYIFGVNSFDDNQKTSQYVKKGSFSVTFKDLPIKRGILRAAVGIWGEDVTKVFDYYEDKSNIRFVSSGLNQGLLEVNYEWD